jgi:hypothetical protein
MGGNMGNGLNNFVAAAAGVALAAAPMAAHAADKTSAVLNAPASQVASVDSSVAVRTEMESLIPEGLKPKFYLPLSPDSKQTIAFFYQGFKEKVGDKASLSALLEKAVVLLYARESNNKSVEDMKKAVEEMEKTGKEVPLSRLVPISSPIFTISAILPSSDNSPYSQAFATLQQEMEAKYTKGKALQDAIKSKDPEAVKAAKRNLEAAQRVLEDSEARLAASRATLQTLQGINHRLAKK